MKKHPYRILRKDGINAYVEVARTSEDFSWIIGEAVCRGMASCQIWDGPIGKGGRCVAVGFDGKVKPVAASAAKP